MKVGIQFILNMVNSNIKFKFWTPCGSQRDNSSPFGSKIEKNMVLQIAWKIIPNTFWLWWISKFGPNCGQRVDKVFLFGPKKGSSNFMKIGTRYNWTMGNTKNGVLIQILDSLGLKKGQKSPPLIRKLKKWRYNPNFGTTTVEYL